MLKIVEYDKKYLEQISNIIIQDLLTVNSKDYGMERVKKMAEDFTVEKLQNSLSKRKKVFVALIDDNVVGTDQELDDDVHT